MDEFKMTREFLLTSEVANAAGVHPNTVRLYEEWGYLPEIPRTRSGYRKFTESHKEQMILARTALVWPYPGGKEPVDLLVRSAAVGNFGMAMEMAYIYLANVRAEIAQTAAAIEFLHQWLTKKEIDPVAKALSIGEAAEHLNISRDMLRNWERNGLLRVPRNPENGYRQYGELELGRARVIRMLRQAGYSIMAVLRMMIEFDGGQEEELEKVLDSPRPDEDVLSFADHWQTTLAAEEQRALDIIQMLVRMIARRERSA